MDNPKVLKVITPIKCPECGKNIYACQQQVPSSIAWVLEEGAIKQAKDDVRKEVETISFKSEDEKKQVIAWLNSENTIFGPDDVQNIIGQFNGTDEEK